MDIFLNWLIHCYLNNAINLRHSTQRIISCYTHKMAIVSWSQTLWRHFTLRINYPASSTTVLHAKTAVHETTSLDDCVGRHFRTRHFERSFLSTIRMKHCTRRLTVASHITTTRYDAIWCTTTSILQALEFWRVICQVELKTTEKIEKKQLKANTGIAEKLRSRWRKWMMREELWKRQLGFQLGVKSWWSYGWREW